jgi:hypothetical protein
MHRTTLSAAALICGTTLSQVGLAQTILFQNIGDNGFFAPFTPASPAGIRYGDAGWLTAAGEGPRYLSSIRLQLAAFDTVARDAGTTDITFRFHDGDPAGLFFGPGTVLYSTTITGVQVPAVDGFGPSYFDLTVPLPQVRTAGNFNNIGFSIGVQNYAFAGNLGFACATASSQPIGYYTNNASFYNGTAWSLFAFSPDPVTGVANFVATIEGSDTPPPCGASDVASAGQTIGPDGQLTADDIIVFIGWFFAADSRADVAGPGQDPFPDSEFTADDIILFINRFFAGC